MSSFIDKIGILGIGQAGNNGAIAAKDVGFTKIALMNTSSNDMSSFTTALPQLVLNNEKAEDDGVAQDRNEAKKRFRKNRKAIFEFIKEHFSNVKLLFIVSSTTGGSGSGLAPTIASFIEEYINDEDNNLEIHPVLLPFVGAANEGKQSALNTKSYLQEVYDEDFSILHINNGVMGGNTKRLLELNKTIMQHLFDFFKENKGSVHGNLDNKEKIKTFKPSGNIVFSKITKDSNFSKALDKLTENLNNGILLKPEYDKSVGISSILVQTKNEKILDDHFNIIKDLQYFMGDPLHNFKGSYIGNENSIFVIYSGLTNPKSFLKNLNKKIEDYISNHKQRDSDLSNLFDNHSNAEDVFSFGKTKTKKKKKSLTDFNWDDLEV